MVQAAFLDSVIQHYKPSVSAIANEKDLVFWKSRVDSLPQSFVNLEKYASALATRFHIYGSIQDLKLADSILQNLLQQYKEPGFLLSLAGLKMLQHRFADAKKEIEAVVQMKAERYAAQMMLFDADLELGNYYAASQILRNNYAPRDYAYNFRLSKFDHYRGEVDSAVWHMLKAANAASSNHYLRSAALSNAADLYLHEGRLKKAEQLYRQCILLNSCDFHSIMGLGWIALVHDGNEELANKVFPFVKEKTKSPYPLFKLYQANELKSPELARKYALEFVGRAQQPVYGNMYAKYLIQVYTGILNNPWKAVSIARKEITLRSTPQAYVWLAWSLFASGQKQEAYQIYQEHISGKALEALELFWVGKMLKGLGKNYNARQFFKAAGKNKYDLSPMMAKNLEENF